MPSEHEPGRWVVVGLDGSQAAREAFSEAVREASWRQCRVLALHVVIVPLRALYAIEPDGLDDLEDYGARIIDRELELLRERHGGEFPVEVVGRAVTGNPGDCIVTEATDVDGTGPAELIVVGSRGLGGVPRLVLGSVSMHVVHRAPCAVLIIRSDGEPYDEDADD